MLWMSGMDYRGKVESFRTLRFRPGGSRDRWRGVSAAMRGVFAVALMCSWLGGACESDQEQGAAPRSLVDRVNWPSSTTADASVPAGLPKPVRWAYMLQNDVVAEIADKDFNVAVMDYTKDGTGDPARPYTRAEIARISRYGGRGGAERTVLAYLSVGEAEDYRYYFDPAWTDDALPGRSDPDAPGWLGRANPAWEGDYNVRYWHEAWQRIILRYVDRIVACGFDGVYLDIIDGFEYWSDEGNGEGFTLSEAEAAERMMAFVMRIAAHARARDEDFMVIPQNGERILAYDNGGGYLRTIDGIAVEDLFYSGRDLMDGALSEERITWLEVVAAAGKPVMVVDYVYTGSLDSAVEDFIARAEAAGYFPYAAATDRELDRLVIFPGQGE
jgi:cysteinyl-tRNA synthetase